MWISHNILKLAKSLLFGGVPSWFVGLLLTENFNTGEGPREFEVAFATFLRIGGLLAIAAGLAALVVGAAVLDLRESKTRTRSSR